MNALYLDNSFVPRHLGLRCTTDSIIHLSPHASDMPLSGQIEGDDQLFLISVASSSFTMKLFVFIGMTVVIWDWSECL